MAYCVNDNPIFGNSNTCATSWNVHIGACAGGRDDGTGGGVTGMCANVFVGASAGRYVTGSFNTHIGLCAGSFTCESNYNTIVGVMAAYCRMTGSNNTIIGSFAGGGIFLSSNCMSNETLIGHEAGGTGIAVRQFNVGVGFYALRSPCTDPTCANIALGRNAGQCIAHCFNVVIGGSLASGLTTSNNIIIADGAGNCLLYGDRLGNIGLGNQSPAVRLHATGAIFATGEIIAYYSDRRLKENIVIIDCSLDKVNKLNSVYYTPNKLAENFGFKSKKKEIGLLADEVESEIPEVVTLAPFDLDSGKISKSGNNYKTIKYERLVPLLVEAIKELTLFVDNLENEINVFVKEK